MWKKRLVEEDEEAMQRDKSCASAQGDDMEEEADYEVDDEPLKEEEEAMQRDQPLASAQGDDVEEEAEMEGVHFKLMPALGVDMPVGTNVWRLRSSVVLDALDKVMGLQQDEPYMPFYGQKQVQTRLYNEWLKSDDRRNADQAAARACAFAPAQGVSLERTLKSYYRRYVMRAWGSLEWLHAFIGLGSLPTSFVDIVRRLCVERKAFAPAQGNPRQLKRAQRTEPEKGIQHKVTEAKQPIPPSLP